MRWRARVQHATEAHLTALVTDRVRISKEDVFCIEVCSLVEPSKQPQMELRPHRAQVALNRASLLDLAHADRKHRARVLIYDGSHARVEIAGVQDEERVARSRRQLRP